MRVFRISSVLLVAFLLLTAAVRHPFHVGITEIDYNAQTQGLEVAVKLFTDDLEDALEARGEVSLKMGSSEEAGETDEMLAKYLIEHLKIEVNGQLMALTYLGKEYEEDAVWAYLEVLQVMPPKHVQVTNTTLMELFDDQKHIVHVRVAGDRESVILDGKKRSGELEF
ncbi:DUF6702 family protein [Pontibacter sp. G13]|uniref:DUF6702 family protein n=1 Tax=Pontibacter sp. G13 TaxID=3074898 RepID=UPI00288AA728|nr:DUF6702 family protein [Pontibacter sp. G13]WNJ18879.1 hypothetical protein RJD25_00185 [Pontibacter sp. G13]